MRELELVRDFVNTLELEGGADQLDSTWLVARGLLRPGQAADEDDLRRAAELREALRALAFANNGCEADVEAAGRILDAQARRSGLAVRFRPGLRLEPGAPGVDGALGQLLEAVATAMAEGLWARFKACRDETCGWAFVDRARNRSRQWCSMEVCGNRAKARAYRRRHTAAR
jgi:predicted RNA-binding Zn ribbon-like protein